MGITLQEFVEAIRDCRRVEAIKALREVTDLGLKEAKEAVDAFTPKVVSVGHLYHHARCVVCGQQLGALYHKHQHPPPFSLTCPTCAERKVACGDHWAPLRT